jgi:hypothetical protein
MQRWIRDLISGIVILVVGIGGYVYSFDVEEGAVKNPLAGAGAYIRLWMILLALLAVILIVKSVWNRTSEKAPAVMYPLIYMTLAAVLFYVGLISVLGYTVSTILFLAILMTVYDFFPRRAALPTRTSGRGAKYLVISVVMTVVVDQILPSCLR